MSARRGDPRTATPPRDDRRRAALRRDGRRGFTLLEMLIVVGFTAGLLAAAVGSYLQLSNASRAASEATRAGRQAAALLDRVARDLEGARLLLRPEDVDPLSHPWIFLAESRRSREGADRLKFVSRSHEPRSSVRHESDLVLLSYVLDEARDGSLVLYRSLRTHLSEQLDRRFPSPDDPDVAVFAEDLAVFGIRLLDENGAWVDEWDSSTLERSGQLPVAAEIRVALLEPGTDPADDGVGPLRVRRVTFPVRPLDLDAELERAAELRGEDDEDGDEAAEGEDEAASEDEPGCMTVNECIAKNPGALSSILLDDEGMPTVLESIGDQCFSRYADIFGALVQGCQ